MNFKAQGSLEYLLLVGGGVLVAAIVIAIIVSSGSAGQDVTECNIANSICETSTQASCDRMISVKGTQYHCIQSSGHCVADGCPGSGSPSPPSSCTTPADCDDSDPCTTDSCKSGVCDYASASDGTPCAGGVCDSGACAIDKTPPETMAVPPSGSVPLAVTLYCVDDIGGTGCDKTEYCLTGPMGSECDPTIQYSTPIQVTVPSTTIRYRSTDKAGNAEEIKSSTYN